jgi:uncharacterized protein DUF4328
MTYPPPPYPGSPEPAGFDAPPPPPVSKRPARGLVLAAAGSAIALTLFELVQAVLAQSAQSTYIEAAQNGTSALDVYTPYDFSPIGWLIFGIASYVLTCLWLYQARANAEVLHPYVRHTRSRGWVWGGWVTPFVSLWFPYQVVRDVSKRTNDDEPSAWLGWWWTFWLLSLVTAQIGPRLIGYGEIDVDAAQSLGTVEAVNAVFSIVALACWLIVMRRITVDQNRGADVPT